MRDRTIPLLALVSTLVTGGILWGTSVPLGVPDEWTWPRFPIEADWLWRGLIVSVTALAYVAFIEIGARRIDAVGSTVLGRMSWLAGLGVASFVWLGIVQETAPPAGQLAKSPFVLYYPSSSGYFFHARYHERDPQKLLREYEGLMRQGDVLHIGTHPPGLFLVFHGLDALVTHVPALKAFARATEPVSFSEAAAIVRENAATTSSPFEPHDEAVLWLATLLAMGLAAATVWPLYGLLRRLLDRSSAWRVAALWSTIPAVAVFLPKSDAAFPFVSALFLWLTVEGWRRRSPGLAALAGGIAFLGLFCSLAFVPVLLCGLLVVVWEGIHELRQGHMEVFKLIVLLGCAFAGVAAPIILLRVISGISLPNVWWWNYHNHAGFYGQYVRTYLSWLLINPLELMVFAGPALLLSAGLGIAAIVRTGGWAKPSGRALLVGAGVWAMLWISGKNSGEAGRLWILMMPGLVVATGAGLAITAQSARPSIRTLRILLALQLCASACVVHRINGFHLGAN